MVLSFIVVTVIKKNSSINTISGNEAVDTGGRSPLFFLLNLAISILYFNSLLFLPRTVSVGTFLGYFGPCPSSRHGYWKGSRGSGIGLPCPYNPCRTSVALPGSSVDYRPRPIRSAP